MDKARKILLAYIPGGGGHYVKALITLLISDEVNHDYDVFDSSYKVLGSMHGYWSDIDCCGLNSPVKSPWMNTITARDLELCDQRRPFEMLKPIQLYAFHADANDLNRYNLSDYEVVYIHTPTMQEAVDATLNNLYKQERESTPYKDYNWEHIKQTYEMFFKEPAPDPVWTMTVDKWHKLAMLMVGPELYNAFRKPYGKGLDLTVNEVFSDPIPKLTEFLGVTDQLKINRAYELRAKYIEAQDLMLEALYESTPK